MSSSKVPGAASLLVLEKANTSTETVDRYLGEVI